MKCNRSIDITGGSSNFRRSAASVYRSARLLFIHRYSERSGHPAALGRVNLSRAPHCPAAFSHGNEVMETRLDLPFLRCTTYNFISSFFSDALLPFYSVDSPPLVFLHSFFLSACHQSHLCRNRIRFAVFVNELRL